MEKLIKELEDKVNRTEKNLTKAVKKNEQLEEKLRATEGELQVRPAGVKEREGLDGRTLPIFGSVTRSVTSFKMLKWPQTKMHTISDTIFRHSFSCSFTWCDPFCSEC